MRVYEEDYSELEEWVEKMVKCGKKLLDKMGHEDEDYEYRSKTNNRYRY